MHEWNGFREKLEDDLSFLLAPELAAFNGAKVYCVWASEAEVDWGYDVGGLTSPTLASWLKPEIGTRWQGNGPCMILNDRLATSSNAAIFDFMPSIACHELAHIVRVRSLFEDDIRHSMPFKIAIRKMNERCFPEFDDSNPNCAKANPKWLDGSPEVHDAQFFRLMLHIRERLIGRGQIVSMLGMIDWSFYSAIVPFRYRQLLEDEFSQLRQLTLSELAKTLPPFEFLEALNNDRAVVTRFRSSVF